MVDFVDTISKLITEDPDILFEVTEPGKRETDLTHIEDLIEKTWLSLGNNFKILKGVIQDVEDALPNLISNIQTGDHKQKMQALQRMMQFDAQLKKMTSSAGESKTFRKEQRGVRK